MTMFLRLLYIAGNKETYLWLHKLPDIFRRISMKFGFSGQTFLAVPNIKFQEKPSSRNRADTCRQTGGETD
jgi:hypothetical protein